MTQDDALGMVLRGLSEDRPEDLIWAMGELSRIARSEGLLALEARLTDFRDPLLRTLMILAVDGSEPATIQEVAANHRRAQLTRRAQFIDLVTTGVSRLQNGTNPGLVVELMYSILGKEVPISRYIPEEARNAFEPGPRYSPAEVLSQEEIENMLEDIRGTSDDLLDEHEDEPDADFELPRKGQGWRKVDLRGRQD